MIAAALLLAAAAPPPQTALVVPPAHRLVEGIATDGRTIFVSSVLDRQMLACRAACRPLVTLPAGLHPMGMAWDARRQRLWIAADCPLLPGVTRCERGALVEVDARGRLRGRFAPAQGAFHPGDVSVGPGAVFVGDSLNGAVYRLRASAAALDTIVAPGLGKSSQGSALDPSGRHLIVADYALGIASIDPRHWRPDPAAPPGRQAAARDRRAGALRRHLCRGLQRNHARPTHHVPNAPRRRRIWRADPGPEAARPDPDRLRRQAPAGRRRRRLERRRRARIDPQHRRHRSSPFHWARIASRFRADFGPPKRLRPASCWTKAAPSSRPWSFPWQALPPVICRSCSSSSSRWRCRRRSSCCRCWSARLTGTHRPEPGKAQRI